MRVTDVADAEQLLPVLVQSIPSPKAEPFKLWLAARGARAVGRDRQTRSRAIDRDAGDTTYRKGLLRGVGATSGCNLDTRYARS